MSQKETWRTRKYWSQTGGLLIEEFLAVNGTKTVGRRPIDGVIVLNEESSIHDGNFYDIEGKITEDNTGVAEYQFTVNDRGWRINSIRIDGKGNRIIDENGIAEVRNIFDENGYLVEQQYYNIDGSYLRTESIIPNTMRMVIRLNRVITGLMSS